MSKNDNSYESEGCSICQEDEIVSNKKANIKGKEEPEEEADPAKLQNYKLLRSISYTLDTILENNKKKGKILSENKVNFLLVQI